MGKFKEMDLLRQEREAFDADYPLPPPPHWVDLWVAWNSEDGFTFWEDEQQAIRWSADKSVEWPVQYVMQKERAAPVREHVAFKVIKGELCYKSQDDGQSFGMWCPVTPQTDLPFVNGTEFYATPPAANKPWIGLSISERDALYCKNYQWDDYGKAIEAKLKEKNRG